MDRKFVGWTALAVGAVVIAAGLLASASMAGCGKRGSESKGTLIAYGRENNSGTYMYFKEHVLKNQDFASGIQTLPGTAAVINAVSKDPHSMGYGGIGYAKGVKVLAVKKDDASPAVEPSMATVVDGSYPISRSLYFYTVGEPTGTVREFVEWTLGEEGQKICQDVGYYPLPADKKVTLKGDAAPEAKKAITLKGSDTMVILGQRWAEKYMEKKPEISVQVTGGGSGTGIAALINGSTDICEASRPMTPKEKDQIKAKLFGKDVCEIPVALDGIAIFVNENCPVKEASLEQLKGIYTGKITSWSDLGWKE
jgi:ABC-type phosphate transport system substrate-binding protein